MDHPSTIFRIAACVLLMSLQASGQEYHVKDLTPAGYGWARLTGVASGKQVGIAGLADRNREHSMLLSGTALNAQDLTPFDAGYRTLSSAASVDAAQQAGGSYVTSPAYTFSRLHAMVWTGSYLNGVDLTPDSDGVSYCFGVDNGEQVGRWGAHAYSWHGSAASAVDLHIGSWPVSVARACRNGEEVGFVSLYPDAYFESMANFASHAVRWNGTAASAVDLHPEGLDSSEALCTTGTRQGGWGFLASRLDAQVHALMWSGDAASVLDLHPAGFSNSRITAMSGTLQAGDGWVGAPGAAGSVRHALVWSGTPESVVDLNPFLPAGYTHAVATGVDTDGSIVGYAYNTGVVDSIAVMFVPGPASPAHLASVNLAASDVAPGGDLQGTVVLDGAAPAGGVTIQFQGTYTGTISDQVSDARYWLGSPPPVVVPEGETSAAFALPITATYPWQRPISLRLHANDGAVTRGAAFTVSPVVTLAALYGDTHVEGGFDAIVRLDLSAYVRDAEGTVVSLTSSDPSLLNVPSTLTMPFDSLNGFVSAATAVVGAATPVTVTATCNGKTLSAVFVLNPPPVITVGSISVANCVGGQSATGTVTMNYPVRLAAGAEVSLASSDRNLRVPSSVTVPFGASKATFTASSSIVKALTTATVTATHAGTTVSGTVNVNPIPTVSVVSADWDPATSTLKVQATTSYQPSILTFGTDSSGGPLGTMKQGPVYWSATIVLPNAPKTAIVWNSNGGQGSLPVTVKGGGGGGTTTSGSYKLSISTNGKGTVSVSPSATSYAPGTVVTLTATPAVGSLWTGWSGDATGSVNPTTITLSKDMKVTANFR